MTILPVVDSGTAQNFFAGVPTKTLASAPWIKSSIPKLNRSRFCSGEKFRLLRLFGDPVFKRASLVPRCELFRQPNIMRESN
jgi:hypothetical protein